MSIRLTWLAMAGAAIIISGLGMTGSADARMGNASFAGSKAVSSAVSSRPTPTPPRTTGRPHLNVVNDRLDLHCRHIVRPNELGVRHHSVHCR